MKRETAGDGTLLAVPTNIVDTSVAVSLDSAQHMEHANQGVQELFVSEQLRRRELTLLAEGDMENFTSVFPDSLLSSPMTTPRGGRHPSSHSSASEMPDLAAVARTGVSIIAPSSGVIPFDPERHLVDWQAFLEMHRTNEEEERQRGARGSPGSSGDPRGAGGAGSAIGTQDPGGPSGSCGRAHLPEAGTAISYTGLSSQGRRFQTLHPSNRSRLGNARVARAAQQD